MEITTIKLKKETKERLGKLKESRRESYDDIIRKILYVLNTTRDNPNKAKLILERIDELRKRMFDEEKEERKEQKKKSKTSP
ncbi:MAG: hypothetical protein WC260_02025 [Candidatus Pacearchaeota archaeon]